jgi:hypothetical protein
MAGSGVKWGKCGDDPDSLPPRPHKSPHAFFDRDRVLPWRNSDIYWDPSLRLIYIIQYV